MAEYSNSNIRCLKCVFVVMKIFPQIMQRLMDASGTKASTIHARIQRDQDFKRKLTTNEHSVLQTLLQHGYTKLDLTLIFRIIKRYKDVLVSTPTRGWHLTPSPSDINIGDDAQRIRLKRNCFLHRVEVELSEIESEEFFSEVISICERVDHLLGCSVEESFKLKVERYKTQPLGNPSEIQRIYDEERKLTEFFVVQVGETKFTAYKARSVKDLIQQLRENHMPRQENPDSITVTLNFPEINTEYNQIMNGLREEINNGSVKIERFREGSLLIDITVPTAILLKDEQLQEELTKFLEHLATFSVWDEVLNSVKPIHMVTIVLSEYEGGSGVYAIPSPDVIPFCPDSCMNDNRTRIRSTGIRETLFKEHHESSTPKPRGMLSDRFEYILAIDIGTIYSGYAWANRKNIDLIKGDVDVKCPKTWDSGTPGFISSKTATCVLLDKTEKLVAFGFDAENKFCQIVEEMKRNDYFFFRRFKMILYEKEITPDLHLTDETGKTMLAQSVFASAISALTQEFFNSMVRQGISLKAEDVRFVVTVPAIWSDAAKQLMRQAANEAGIENEQLVIALEPEAASIYSHFVESKAINQQRLTVSKVGTRYLVADLGGGTADISVHEKLENGHLKELHRSRGDKCGGDSINDSFIYQISKIFSFKLMTKVMKEYPLIYWEVHNAFEAAKMKFGARQANQMTVKLPMMFLQDFFKKETGKDLIQEINLDRYKGAVTIKHGDHTCVEKAYAENNLFKPTTDKVVQLLKSIISEVEGNPYKTISKIILVGGLSGSMYIQDAVREAFPDKHVITPESSQLCVLKGAVLFGRKPELISYRVMRFTYGISTYELFDPKKHEEKRKKTLNGVDYCTQIFTRYAEIGTTVEVNTPITRRLSTACPLQKKISFPIYTSSTCKPNYVDDEGCQKIGVMTIEISDPIEEKKYFNVSLICGNTELRIYAKDITNTTDYTAKLDFLMH